MRWTTGWLGIRIAGMKTYGFADVWLTPGRNARALFSVSHDDGEMYDMLEMRYARSRARVNLYLMLPGIAEAFGEKDAFDLSASELLPKSERQSMRASPGSANWPTGAIHPDGSMPRRRVSRAFSHICKTLPKK